MLLPIYTIAALINIFAKSQNFNIQVPNNLPYDIRIKRDISGLSDISIERAKTSVNNFNSDKEVIKLLEKLLDEVKNSVDITEKKGIIEAENDVETGETDNEYKSSVFKNVVNNVYKILHELEEGLESSHSGDDVSLFNIKTKQRDVVEKPENEYTDRKYKKHLTKHEGNLYERIKRNVNYKEGVYIGNNQNNDKALNYIVTEKTTLSKAVDWLNSWIHPHEKHIIRDTEHTSNFETKQNYIAPNAAFNTEITTKATPTFYNSFNNLPFTTYNYERTTKMVPTFNYNWNNNQLYAKNNENTYKPPYNANGSYVNYINQPYSYYGYNNTQTKNVTKGLSPLYNGNYTGVYTNNNGYTNNSYSGYNNSYGYGYNPYPIYNDTNVLIDNKEETKNSTVVPGCIFCSSIGCPKFTVWRGIRCVPIRKK